MQRVGWTLAGAIQAGSADPSEGGVSNTFYHAAPQIPLKLKDRAQAGSRQQSLHSPGLFTPVVT